MDVANYYVTTLSNAAAKIGPVVIFIVVGYFVFIKLPFMFVMKVNKDQKAKPEEDKKNPQVDLKNHVETKIKLDSVPLQEKMSSGSQENSERLKKKEQEREQERLRQQRKKEEREKSRAENGKKEQKQEQKQQTRPKSPISSHAFEIFEIKPGEMVSKSALKKRYHELLRQNHPDKVAALGEDLKNLAEKKTKEINSAYEELKKKAS
jgi:DnaJ-domain-containing protein 1